MVGTLGSAELRRCVLTAIARSLPVLINEMTDDGGMRIASISPPRTAVSPCDASLNGTCSSLTLAIVASNSPARCPVVPLPDDEEETLPGLSLARLTKPASVLYGELPTTTSALGTSPTNAT